VLAVKTPLPFVMLCLVGVYCLARHGVRKLAWQPWAPGVAALTVLLVCLPSSINLGVRHILPIYPLVAIFAGLGLAHLLAGFPMPRPDTGASFGQTHLGGPPVLRPATGTGLGLTHLWRDFAARRSATGASFRLTHLWREFAARRTATGHGFGLAHPWRRPATIAGAALALWLVAGSLLAHPDYLAWFNEIASSKPEYFLAESDLDWGQDLQRLSNTLRRLGVQQVHLGYFGTADLARHHLPAIQGLSVYRRETGWVAVSIRYLTIGAALVRQQHGGNPLAWLKEEKPVLRVGKSIYLYHLYE